MNPSTSPDEPRRSPSPRADQPVVTNRRSARFVQGVLVTPRVAALLSNTPEFAQLRARLRSGDEEVYGTLVDVTQLGLLAVNASAPGSTSAPHPEAAAPSASKLLTTTQAAVRLGISSRAVRLACETGRLPASKTPDGRWQIPAQAVSKGTPRT